jgi:hypothetical protein
MHRSTRIVLGTPAAPLPPEPKARPRPGSYWRHWRNGGAALSLLLHVLAIAALTMSMPVFGGPAAEQTAIPVEIVKRPPAPKSEEPKAETPKPEEPKKAEGPEAKKIPVAPKPAAPAPPPAPAAKPAPEPAAPQPEATPRATPPPAPPPPPILPEARLPPEPPPIPDAPRPQGPPGGLKVDADVVPLPSDKQGFGHWVLEPLTVNLKHRCGLARITGVLELKERLSEGRYRGVIQTRITWALCPPEGVVHAVELHIDGSDVRMIGADGSIDHGVIRANTMMLEDAYGRSVWKKR